MKQALIPRTTKVGRGFTRCFDKKISPAKRIPPVHGAGGRKGIK